MNDSLKKGTEKGLWERVPDSPGYYTADMKLVDKEEKAKKFGRCSLSSCFMR
jgi:hypothetical protein